MKYCYTFQSLCLAVSKLEELQEKLKLKKHKLIQDIPYVVIHHIT